MNTRSFLFTAVMLVWDSAVLAQATSNPAEYMNQIGKEFKAITTDLWDYTSAAAHGKSARKVENRRKELLKTILEAKNKTRKMADFKDDKSLRDSVVSFLELTYNVLNNDYAKILDMEEIAEQSYDLMEAYLLAQEKASEKLDQASEMISAQEKLFAEKHNVNLLEGKDKTSQKLESAGKVSKYYNVIYLIFFKSFKQEAYLLDAMSKNDVNGIEQNKNALAKWAEAGLLSLDSIQAFNGDVTLKTVCKELLTFYKTEANTKVPEMVNYYLKKENFEKIKTSFDAKPQNQRTKADVDQYNKAVNEMNAEANKVNLIHQDLNKRRSVLLDKWNNTVQTFFHKHTPKYKG